MKNNNTFLSLFLLVVMCVMSPDLDAQQQTLDTISRKFRETREQALQEKLYLHLDRDFYLTGESMWFRIYQVDGALHRPVNLSKVAYVEVLDRDNESVVQAKIELKADGGHGTVFIPATLSTGNYVVRAYTQWMKNFSPEFYFHKTVSIVNPFLKPELADDKKPSPVKIEFFPEGGNLVAGFRSKVAFKLTPAAETEHYSGVVLNEEDDTVSVLEPLKFGLGHFYLNPSQGRQYRCILRDTVGKTSTHQLPEVHQSGFVMRLSDSIPERITVRIRSKGQSSLTYAYLFVHARQMIVHAEMKPVHPEQAEFLIDRNKIPEGITHFTVFNGDMQPVCERLYFRKPETVLQVELATDQKEYSPRRKVSLDVRSLLDGKDAPASLSVSVFRRDSLGDQTTAGIVPWMLLTSDLKGTIESPEYYFTNDPDAREAADNLMLTHGWRRFRWQDVMGQQQPFAWIPEMRTHLVSGKVTNSKGAPVPNVLAFLSSPSRLVGLNGSRSNNKGELVFEVQDFYGSRKLVLQSNSHPDSAYRLSIRDPFSKSFSSYNATPINLSSSGREALKLRSLSMQVQDIYYRDVSEKPVTTDRDSSAFYGKSDQTFYLDRYTRFPVMEEVMREYVPGVMVRKRRDGFHFLVISAVNKGILDGDPLVLLDGVPVFDLNKLMEFDPLKIKKLEVVMRHYLLGPIRVPGIVSYSTYSGDLAGFEFTEPAVVLDYEGLQMRREFYSPTYENSKVRANRMPDQRTLLLWKPVVNTSAGSQTVEFYTSDIPGTYEVVVEGLTDSGRAGSGSHTFTVRRLEL